MVRHCHATLLKHPPWEAGDHGGHGSLSFEGGGANMIILSSLLFSLGNLKYDYKTI